MAFTLIKAKDKWSSTYRYIETDIAPILHSQTPYYKETASGNYTVGNYYQSAGYGSGDYVYFFCLFNSEPTITQVTLGHNLDNPPFYDTNSGLWVLMSTASFGLGDNWTDPNVPIETDFTNNENFFDYRVGGQYSTYTFAYYLNYIKTQPPITYNWQSVPSISGKNGISLLSIIKSSAINSGDAVSGATADAFDRLEESTKISTLIQGISEETPIIYSDDVNYMSITPTANNTCTLKFYLHGNVIYTLTDVSINAYLSFLIDEANGIMKPSIIYEDS